jgi:hypothetical protein
MSFNIGDILNVSDGTWYGNNTFTYQWLRDGIAIPGAISSRYVIVAADNETSLSAVITATNATGSVSVAATNSAPVTGSILMGPPASLTLAAGTITVGHLQIIDLASLTLTSFSIQIDVSVIPDLATLALTELETNIIERLGVDAPGSLTLTDQTVTIVGA